MVGGGGDGYVPVVSGFASSRSSWRPKPSWSAGKHGAAAFGDGGSSIGISNATRVKEIDAKLKLLGDGKISRRKESGGAPAERDGGGGGGRAERKDDDVGEKLSIYEGGGDKGESCTE